MLMSALGARAALKAVGAGTVSASAGSFAANSTAIGALVAAAVSVLTFVLLVGANNRQRRADIEKAKADGRAEEREKADHELHDQAERHRIELNAANELAARNEREMTFYRAEYTKLLEQRGKHM